MYRLYLPDEIGADGLSEVTKMVGRGKVASLYVKDTVLKTDQEVKRFCTALALAQRWKINWLRLPDNIGADDWAELTKVFKRGEVAFLYANKVAFNAASKRQIDALKQVTDHLYVDGKLQKRNTNFCQLF